MVFSCFPVSVLASQFWWQSVWRVVEAWLELVGVGLNRLGLVLCFGGVVERERERENKK